MTIPAESIPSGNYEVRATARQAAGSASSSTMILIEQWLATLTPSFPIALTQFRVHL
jgi:hypothetical protein